MSTSAEEFFEAVKNSNASSVKDLIQGAGAKFLNTPNRDGEYAVHGAVKARALNVLTVLLEAGANPNQASEELGTYAGYTAGHYAARNDDVDALLLLHKNGADLNRTAEDGWTPLHAAAFGGKFQAMKMLVSHNVDVNVRNKHNITPILFAVNHGRVTHVRELLAHGAQLDAVDVQGDTILHHCFHYQMSKMFEGEYDMPEVQFDVAVLLAIHGVDVERANSDGKRATHYLEEDVPALLPVLKILRHHHEKFKNSKTDWNYMTLVNAAKIEHFLGLGLEMTHAVDLYENLQKLEQQRLAEKKRREEERPAGGCPVMRGKKKKGAAAQEGASEQPPAPGADPSGGKCPFFKKGGGAAQGPPSTMEVLPDGHPPVSDGAGSTGAASKCPFAGKAAEAASRATGKASGALDNEPPIPAASVDAARPKECTFTAGPSSILNLLFHEYRETAMLVIIAFFCGIWFEQACASVRAAIR